MPDTPTAAAASSPISSAPAATTFPAGTANATDPKKFMSMLAAALQNLVRLDVITVVTANQTPDPSTPATGPYMLTAVKLLEGDILCEVNEALLDDKYAAIRAAHAEREKQALEIVNGHVALIEKVVTNVVNWTRQSQ
jgi:hypothetical protein